jgi:hypothetical protein
MASEHLVSGVEHKTYVTLLPGKVKVKFSMSTLLWHMEGIEVYFHPFLTSTLMRVSG